MPLCWDAYSGLSEKSRGYLQLTPLVNHCVPIEVAIDGLNKTFFSGISNPC
jgi:hypothetical protein